MIACIYKNILWVLLQNDIWPIFEIFNASIYVTTSTLMSCSNCCVDVLCMSTVVRVFCTVYSTDFAFCIMSSLSSIGGLDVKVFVEGGFGKPKQQDLFLQQ